MHADVCAAPASHTLCPQGLIHQKITGDRGGEDVYELSYRFPAVNSNAHTSSTEKQFHAPLLIGVILSAAVLQDYLGVILNVAAFQAE
jgi:hypothetical protein